MPSDPDAQLTIVSARTFDVPPDRLFDAFVDPARLARWWGPAGFRNTIDAFDPRPGGAWRGVMHAPDGRDFPFDAVFLEVERPSRIVLSHPSPEHAYVLTITLEEAGAGARCTWAMRHDTAEACARVRPFVVAGNEQNFDRLAAELARTA